MYAIRSYYEIEKLPRHRPRLLLGAHDARPTALQDRLVGQTPGPTNVHQGRDADGTRGLAEQRHVAGIATEGLDVVAHPFERNNFV